MVHPRFHAASTPDKPAVIMAGSGETLTYGSLELRANQGAHYLRSMGVGPGDCIAVWLPNGLTFVEVYWAAQRAGLFVTPVSTKLKPAEAAYILADCHAKLLVTSSAIEGVSLFLGNHRGDCPDLVTVLTDHSEIAGLEQWNDAIAAFPVTPIADESAGFHMVYSSGTTGRPKGVKQQLSGAPATQPHLFSDRLSGRYGINDQTVMLSPAPFYHTAPLAYANGAARLGATVVMMEQFDAEAALAAIAQYKVTFSQMVPTMFHRLLQLPDDVRRRYDMSSLQCIVHAAAPCPIPVKRAMLAWLGPIIYEYYGGSEGNGSTYITPQEWLSHPGSVGKADWGVLHICDDDGHELNAGQDGVVYFAGGWDFAYLGDEQKTRDARNPLHPSWTTLGDIGHVDDEGYLYLTDRRSYMIITGGVNVYPQEVENLIAVHPKVADVAVIGVLSESMGEEVKAVVQPRQWSDAGEDLADEIIAYCRSELSHVKCPRSVDFLATLPRHDTGKLYKRELRDKYWKGQGKPIG
jgi:long-chain acyl-CoA synthetase